MSHPEVRSFWGFFWYFLCPRDGNRGVHQVRRWLPAGGLALRGHMQRRLLLVRAGVGERPGAEVLQEVSRLRLLPHLQTTAETGTLKQYLIKI